jgi:hypothetical protein
VILQFLRSPMFLALLAGAFVFVRVLLPSDDEDKQNEAGEAPAEMRPAA